MAEKVPSLDRVFPPDQCDDVWAEKVLNPHQYGTWSRTVPSSASPGGEA